MSGSRQVVFFLLSTPVCQVPPGTSKCFTDLFFQNFSEGTGKQGHEERQRQGGFKINFPESVFLSLKFQAHTFKERPAMTKKDPYIELIIPKMQ